ncbi:serine threonine-protein phosphatase 2a 55 kda regulatory subunit b delta isoform [Limosa lapponica baueri]|uniref:Serine/threonine-protein phosphatase 2A 55 kDa regulatory subunit B n=1 Tax=Limosa lapponica baueri TaxID=1758121 RepID=A0A2I0TR16_LIMLA|nr:serine threonine-protein phosphatase 2a 55 kda regulatory subunit b delta isoform [Limosa lapponica baueri]
MAVRARRAPRRNGVAGGGGGGGSNDFQWCFSQVKGAIDEDVAEADIISTVEFNYSGDLLATGDKGGRVVIFQREQENKSRPHSRGEYNVYSTFQSHEPEFDYLKSLEIEEKINKIRWLPQQNAAHFLLSTNDKTIKLWKISERDKRAEGYNLKDEDGRLRDPFRITALRKTQKCEQGAGYSMDIVDIKPANMEELTEVITAAEFHPHHCNVFVYSSSKGTIRLCDMRSSALCDRHSKSVPLGNERTSAIMTGSYNNFFRMFDRNTRRDITLEASRESSKPRAILKPRKVCTGGKRKKDEISVDSLDFNKKILHTAWHPVENIIAVAATNNLYIFQDKIN